MLFRTKFSRLIAFFIIVSLIFGLTGTAFANPGRNMNPNKFQNKFEHKFEHRFQIFDLNEAPWAIGHMTLMMSKGIFKGRGNGMIAPQATVHRAEVLTAAVRLNLMAEDNGYDDMEAIENFIQEEYTNDTEFTFNFSDKAVIERGAASWAAPYIYQAIQLGIIENEGLLNPMKAASRAWVAEILVKTFENFIDEINEEDGTVTFTDLDNLPEEVKNFIEEAVKLGLFSGYPDNTFRPHKPLTRAESMTLMGRADEELQLPCATNCYRGTIESIDEDEISLILKSGEEASFTIDEDTSIFLKGEQATVDMLQPGDKAQVLADAEGNADIIWANFVQWEVTGTVEEIDENNIEITIAEISDAPEDFVAEAGDEISLEIASYCTIRDGGKIYELEDLDQLVAAGDFLELKLHGELVIKIVIEDEE